MAILGFELEEIVRLIALLESSGMAELVWEEEDRFIRIRAPRPAKARVPVPMPPAPGSPPEIAAIPPERPARRIAAGTGTQKQEPTANQIALTSPMVGTFYRADKPGASPLIEVGQEVE